MSENQLSCRQEQRRTVVRAAGRNGIDFIEIEQGADGASKDPPVLVVYFLQPPPSLSEKNFRITGGRRIRGLAVTKVHNPTNVDAEPSVTLRLVLNYLGDLSLYHLAVVKLDEAQKPTEEPPDEFDRRYAALAFSFAVNCPSDLDCQQSADCPAPTRRDPPINYLAKDYASFRQLILDRLALLLPTWQERHVPDLGVALVELLAYVGDHLSYFQDAVATEAYLDTARQRISVRRHARLVDYTLHEGCNARTWVSLQVEGDHVTLDPSDCYFITGYQRAGSAGNTILSEEEVRRSATAHYEVFEPLANAPLTLCQAHNELRFYTWDNSECVLPQGALQATLCYQWQTPTAQTVSYELPYGKPVSRPRKNAPPPAPSAERMRLRVGDVLIFEEVKGARTGNAADADPSRRHAVRLVNVHYTTDTLHDPPIQLVEIAWGQEDALPFAFCLSAPIAPDCELCPDITVARGNVIPVDHGYSVAEIDSWSAPSPTGRVVDCVGEGLPGPVRSHPTRFAPTLTRRYITHRASWDANFTSACAFLQQDLQQTQPVICLCEGNTATDEALHAPVSNVSALLVSGANLCPWQPRPDLLGSGPEDRHFVAEVDNEGIAHLRFGDGEFGLAPAPGLYLRAHYRVGNGVAGNIGARSIAHIVYRRQMISGVSAVTNPLPAQGGVDPQPITEAKLLAPHAFRNQLQRAVTAADYALLAKRRPGVQNATGTLRWNGSWYTAQVTLDPRAEVNLVDDLRRAILDDLAPYRRIGHDLVVVVASYVPLYLSMTVCVKPHYQRGQIKAQLLERLSNRRLRSGERGFFHPHQLTFGQAIHVSALVALAQRIQGVASVEVTMLKRLHDMSDAEGQQVVAAGILPLGALEIAQLDNNPAAPDNGKLILQIRGGR